MRDVGERQRWARQRANIAGISARRNAKNSAVSVSRARPACRRRRPRRRPRSPAASAQQRLAIDDRLVPEVVVQAVDVAAGAGLALAAQQVDLDQVANGAGDRRGADLQPLGELRGGQPAGVGREQRREHARGHARHAAVLEHGAEPLDEARHLIGHGSDFTTFHKIHEIVYAVKHVRDRHRRARQDASASTRALDGLDLEVAEGEVHGFLGPNGAGKSTTIRVLLGLLRADGGHATLLGGDPWREATALHRRLAYVPGDVTLWPNLSRRRGDRPARPPARRARRSSAATRCSSASSSTRPRRAARTPRATARRSRSSPRSPPTSSC